MKSKNLVLDADGETLKKGDFVILLNAPDELLSNLPTEDQMAIKDQVGKTIPVQDFGENGDVELEFESEDETIHFIWINPSHLRKST